MSDVTDARSGGTRESGPPDTQLRHAWVTNRRTPEVVPYAAVNEFWHAGRLPELAGFTSDNLGYFGYFGYFGQRTTGDFAIVGPGWRGDVPPGVRRTESAPTPWVLVLGLGPGPDVEAQPPIVTEAPGRAAVAGMALLRQQFVSGDWAEQVAGWRYPPGAEGRFGDDFLRRAADQCLAGIAANDPAESVYLLNFQDADGAPFAPRDRYRVHFEADELHRSTRSGPWPPTRPPTST